VFEIGNTLREARLRRGLDFRQVETSTKIRGRYLRALEEEDFDSLPAETYVRGFLRGYAEFLGLDGQLYVDEYNSRFVTGEEYAPMRPRRSPPKRTGRGLETNVVLLALTAIGIMTALVIVAWKFSAGPSSSKQTPKPAPVAKTTKPAARGDVTRANLLVTAVRGNSWLEVHANPGHGKLGRLLYQGTLEKGQTQRFVAKRLWVNAGAPENLRVKLNGDRVTIGMREPVVVLVSADSITSAQPQ
jgi:cytoskeleton protein RodZ